jgi:FkbM family methyltransferase
MDIRTNKFDESALKFCDEFINSSRPKYIMGRNAWSNSVTKIINVDGFVDDFCTDEAYLGKPIVKIGEIAHDSMILVVSFYNPKSACNRAKSFCSSVLDYFSFLKISGLDLKQVLYWDGFHDDFEVNYDKYNQTYHMLEDEESKIQFEKIINFRKNYDIKEMASFDCNEAGQYFEDFLSLKSNGEVFVDAGAFDGFTTSQFIKYCPNYQNVYIFEPDSKNLIKTKLNLQNFNHINYFPYGLFSRDETLKFSTGGAASRISSVGELSIQVKALDGIVNGPVTFIKMDIEGAEMDAIEGARMMIQKYRPRLAICAYHKADDLWKIPALVKSIRPDYKVYLRHYMEGITETVLFFV